MEIVKLPTGEKAPQDSDCISIEETSDGRFLLNASALAGCEDEAADADEEGEDDESVSVIGGNAYGSYDEAEAAGLAWAAERCVTFLYISRGTPGEPMTE